MCLRTIATALRDAGHEPTICVPSGTDKALLDTVRQFPILEKEKSAPLNSSTGSSKTAPFKAASFADVLGRIGFAEASTLMKQVKAWRDLFVGHQPDVVICDFSPTACFASHGIAPSLTVGNGYATPPSHLAYFPVLNARVAPTYSIGAISENALSVAKHFGFAESLAATALPRWIAGDRSFIRCFPQFDPYNSVRTQSVLGPLVSVGPIKRHVGNEWPFRFYAYLSANYPFIEQVIQGLCQTTVPGDVFAGRLPLELRERLEASSLNVLAKAPDWNDMLPRVSLVVHQSGLGTAQSCATAGVPQLVIPTHLEHELTSLAVLRLGIGAAIVPPFSAADVATGIERLLTKPAYRDAATKIAAQFSSAGPSRFVEQVVDAVHALS